MLKFYNKLHYLYVKLLMDFEDLMDMRLIDGNKNMPKHIVTTNAEIIRLYKKHKQEGKYQNL